MKKIPFFFLFILAFSACNNKKEGPDISGIKVDLQVERFDQDLFAIDSNNVLPGLNAISHKYPALTSIFLQGILGLDSTIVLPGLKRFLHQNTSIYDSVKKMIPSESPFMSDLNKAFRYVRYYFPEYPIPKIVTVVGPIDALAENGNNRTPDFIGPDFIGISLQFYLGRDFSIYKDPFFIEKIVPEYRSRRFSPEYIQADVIQLVVDDLFPDNSAGHPLIDQMIIKGKQWWLQDQFLPAVADSIKTGFTNDQLTWCKENEGLIWSYIIKNEDINSINPSTIQTYIGDGPFTQGFSQDLSPGNLGQWIGWQIVKKYVMKHSGINPEELMRKEPKEILDEAKYKPK
ncbi:MAG TPA: hypothetical protein VLJ68_00900 [Chitinophagaceae bacterium]|nr:hypothetical protein [Chitinophagaceae bacterium]